MTYQHIGDALQSTTFIHRVQGCIIELASAIIAAAQDSGSIQTSGSADLTTLSCKNWCLNYIKGTTVATDVVIAKLLLLNSVISAAPHDCTDGDLQWQAREILLQLVDIG